MMKPNLEIVSFTYIHLEQLPLLEEILSSNKHGIQQLHDRYVLLSYDKQNKFYHDCPMIELLKKDVLSSGQSWVLKYYNNLIKKFGKELVDLLIIEDEEIIKNKILYIINFAMNFVYKSNALRIEMLKYKESPREISSIPNLIYSTIGENFDIIDQYLLGQQNYIIIKKRSNLCE